MRYDGRFQVTGCRLHDNEKFCAGNLVQARSIFDGYLIVCEKAFNALSKEFWKLDGEITANVKHEKI